MQVAWTRAQLMGYLRSWSATGRYQAAHSVDPVMAFEQVISSAWGDAEHGRLVSLPLSLRVGRASGG